MCFVTMATVGYGDYYPKTHLGRITGVGVCLVGMISVSLFVVFLQQLIEFNPKEQKVIFISIENTKLLYSTIQNVTDKKSSMLIQEKQ